MIFHYNLIKTAIDIYIKDDCIQLQLFSRNSTLSDDLQNIEYKFLKNLIVKYKFTLEENRYIYDIHYKLPDELPKKVKEIIDEIINTLPIKELR